MSLFDDASVVITPNGQKAGKLYSIKPTDGSGDLSVTRATSATRVDANGLVEIPRTNLLLRSEEFNNVYWVKTNVTVTGNSTNSPNGTLTADTIANTSAGGYINNSAVVGSIGVVYSFSFYIKNNTSTSTLILVRESSSALSSTINWNGSVISSVTNSIGFINFTLVGNGWYRITGTYTSLENNQQLRIYPQSVAGNNSVYIWGAQLEQGVSATEYIPTIASIRTKFAGITQDGSSASNIQRLDYTNGSCPSILVEPQRTNIALRSEEFDNASWAKQFSSITANATTSPSGNLTADKLVDNATNNQHRIDQTPTAAIGTYTFSVFLKKAEIDTCWIRIGTLGADFNLTNGTTYGQQSGVTSSIQNYGNGWYRCSITRTTTGANEICRINLKDSNNSTYLGNGTDGLFIWGAQIEAGANATSYIPTTSASVTRNADVISKTGISSLINSVEGCFYVEAKAFVNGGSFRVFSLSDGTANNRLSIAWSSVTNRLLAFMNLGGTIRVNNDILSFNQTSNNKVLFKWGSGNFKVFINGVESLSLTSVTMPTANLFNRLGFDLGSSGSNFEGNVNEVIVFPTQLTDQECINLTTL